ncbi:LOW QUALITY PROTEIN: large ribosomal subunit protein bL19m-like [Liolophura sinensis]|uniref:LOW QUALITY PROTEIN: large ribosomal subunit protein bL19m-like n=1 Tax=Liolophura sinensis TaxID=3198878 RepID=UPI0031597517
MLRSLSRIAVQKSGKSALSATWCRLSSSISQELLDKHRSAKLVKSPEEDVSAELPAEDHAQPIHPEDPKELRDVYPDFLPSPDWRIRDKLTEKLEREDMYRRRVNLDIPEFYVGSVMAVTVADQYAPGKKNRFLGICIHRGGYGLRSSFILRNVIDDEGIEVMYEMYNPLIQKIEVLKLEKRLDDELFYLRDAPKEHSFFPQNMDPVQLPKGRAVPVNTTKVPLNPRPWLERWERKELKGILPLDLPEIFFQKAEERKEPWEKYDLMKQYRARINDVEAADIMAEVQERQQSAPGSKKKPPQRHHKTTGITVPASLD